MQTAIIVGHATATVKHASMAGWKLLIAQPLGVEDNPDGEPQLVIDTFGAGVGAREPRAGPVESRDAVRLRQCGRNVGSPQFRGR